MAAGDALDLDEIAGAEVFDSRIVEGSHGADMPRFFHLATVFGLIPERWAGALRLA
jgi:hypothetical protein